MYANVYLYIYTVYIHSSFVSVHICTYLHASTYIDCVYEHSCTHISLSSPPAAQRIDEDGEELHRDLGVLIQSSIPKGVNT